jgi:hypothetical protein
MALAGKSDQARTAAISELATAEANVGLVEARRVGRLRDVEKQQVATREAIKKSSMTDAEKQASLSVVNREISRTRTELNKVAGTPDPKKKVEVKTDKAQENVQTLTGWLAGLKDKSVTVSVKTEKKAYGGMVKGFATGGTVSGPGGRDRVPAMLTAGEAVLTKKQQALVNSGMTVGEAFRRTGIGGFAKGGFVKPKQKKGEKKADYDRRVAQARKQWQEKQDSQTVPAIQRASQAFGASFLAKFDAGTAKGLKDLANNFVGTGALAGLTFAGIEKQAKAAQAQLDATYNALTPAEAQLKALQDTGAASDRASAIADAQAALANAQQFGDADAIRNATKALGEAQRAEQIAQLQTTADSERAQREKERQAAQDAFTTEWDQKRTDLQDQLDEQTAQYQEARDIERAQRVVDLEQLQTNLEAQKGKYRNHTASVIKMFKRFAQEMEVSGKNIGQSMADGLKAAEGDLRGAAAGLATLLSKWLEAHSPTEKGPMSNLNHWWDGFAPALVSGLDTNSIEGAIASTIASPTIMAGAGVGGSAVTINLTVSDQTFAGMSREQADKVARQVQAAIDRQVRASF